MEANCVCLASDELHCHHVAGLLYCVRDFERSAASHAHASTDDAKRWGSGSRRHRDQQVCDKLLPISRTKFQKNLARGTRRKKRKRSLQDGTGGRNAECGRVLQPLPAGKAWLPHDDPANLAAVMAIYDHARGMKGGRMCAAEQVWPAVDWKQAGRVYTELPYMKPEYLRGEYPYQVDKRKAFLRRAGVSEDFLMDDENLKADLAAED